MKVKLNLNVAAVKHALLQHGEKAAFGLAIFILLMFFWKTLRLEVLGADKQPDQLKSLAEKAQQHVISSEWDKKAKNIEIVDYPARAEHIALVDDNYHLKVFFDKPLWEQHDKRQSPKVWPVEELQAASGQGIFAIKRETGDVEVVDANVETRPIHDATPSTAHRAKLSKDVKPVGFFYVAITGLIPLRKQTAEYEDVFRNAQQYDAGRDVPVYEHEHMKIERAVVGANLDWKEIDLAAVDSFVGKWPSDLIDDAVDSQYYDDACTMPLGPLLGEDWDPNKIGHPKIPRAERLEAGKKKSEKETAEPAGKTRVGWTTKERPGGKPGGPASKAAAPEPAVKGGTTAPKVEQKLFRFVDYTVEAGKQYQYRVKLALYNPNQGIADRYLKDPAQARIPVLETEWSEPTAAVTVPRGISILAGPIVKMSLGSAPPDPEVDVCVISFDRERGAEPAVKKTVQRGSLLNFSVKDVWVPRAGGSDATKWSKVDIRSNVLVVDVQGGRKLTQGKKPLVEPIEILILDADGHAAVHDELDDSEEFHSRLDSGKDPVVKKNEPAADSDDPYKDLKRKPRGEGGKPPKSSPAASKAARATTGN